MDKVKQVADHVNMILRYIPYIQTNFVLGLDGDMGPEPFELTKTFIDLAPGAFPAYSLLSAFGRAAPMNLEYQRAGRVLAVPLPFPEQQSRDERQAQELHLDRVLRWPDRRHQLFVLLARHRAPHSGDRHRHPQVDELRSSGFIGRVRAHPVSHDDPEAARYRPLGAGVSGRGDRMCCRSFTARGSGRSWARCTSCCRRERSSTTRMPTCRRSPRSRSSFRCRCGASGSAEGR